jgi:hypothetical protein
MAPPHAVRAAVLERPPVASSTLTVVEQAAPCALTPPPSEQPPSEQPPSEQPSPSEQQRLAAAADASSLSPAPSQAAQGQRLLCYFLHRHLNFRVPELCALAQLCGVAEPVVEPLPEGAAGVSGAGAVPPRLHAWDVSPGQCARANTWQLTRHTLGTRMPTRRRGRGRVWRGLAAALRYPAG